VVLCDGGIYDCDGTRAEIEHSRALKRIAERAYYPLVVDRRLFAVVFKIADPNFIQDLRKIGSIFWFARLVAGQRLCELGARMVLWSVTDEERKPTRPLDALA
jgi:hypothetical protein